jgi:hypothetical protein
MRISIPEDTAAEVLFQYDHTCCICQERGDYMGHFRIRVQLETGQRYVITIKEE